MASVSLASVSKVFAADVQAVNNITLHVNDGEFLVLLGPSGCGKSTTLRMVAGLEEVSDGEIRIGDRVVNDVAPKDRDIAMVFQNYALYPHMTVYKNMAFGLELRYGGNSFHRIWKRLTSPTEAATLAAKRRGIRDTVRHTAQALGIEHLLDRMPRQLSGGERQRVALGRAIVRHPAVFLLDEPLSNLDAKLRLETRHELKELHQRLQTTMVYVTHDQTEAMTLGDRIVVMKDGEIQQIGSPTEVYDHPQTQFVAGFIGSPPMNFVCGELKVENDETAFVACGLKVKLTEAQANTLAKQTSVESVELGIRPEDLQIQRLDETTDNNTGRVTLVEPLGDCKLVHVEIGMTAKPKTEEKAKLVCKVSARTEIATGERVQVGMDTERLHLFDPTNGRRLAEDRG